MHIKRLQTSGDTIVEVLLAIAILGSVLSGAYVTAGRSQKNIRQAQERGEALQLVQAQIEQVKNKADGNDIGTLFTETSDFCFDYSSNITTSCNFGTDGRYTITIVRTNPVAPAKDYNFTFTAQWDSVVGGQDQITTEYILFK